MQLFNIKHVLFVFLFAVFWTAFPSVVNAKIPVKRICIVNENNAPLLYTDGQGLIVKHNNAFGNYLHKRAGADGCVEFPDTDYFEDKVIKYPDEETGVMEVSKEEGDIGCASGPFGMKVIMPKQWEDQWECQTIGSANGAFPCCRNPQEEAAGKCNVCKVHGKWNGSEYVGGYEDEIASTERQCYCTRSISGRSPDDYLEKDQACPLCFHNSGQTIPVKLQCRKSKTAESISLENPRSEQFSPPTGFMVDCLESKVCSYANLPSPEGEEGQPQQDPVTCSEQNSADSGKRRFLIEKYRETALKYTKIKADNETLESPVHIAECIMEGTNESDARYVCTTGNRTLDAQLGLKDAASGKGSLDYLSQQYGYKQGAGLGLMDETGNPVAQPLAKISQLSSIYEWVSESDKPVRSVFAVYYDKKFAEPANSGDNASQLQRTLSTIGACKLHIDPVGRVFDNHTLEPISGVNMSLERATGQQIAKSVTVQDGKFSFYVSPGTYRLFPQIDTYIFPIGTSVNPKANSIYANFYMGEDIIVKKDIVYMDVPMEPDDKKRAEAAAKGNAPQVMEYFQSINKETEEYSVQGRVSHPRASVAIKTDIANPFKKGQINESRIIAHTTADAYGRFEVIFKLADMKSNETVGSLEVTKPKNVYTFGENTKTAIQLTPLLNSVEGYAFDKDGNIIPGAVVSVKLPVFEKPIYEGQADEKGYFKIPSEKLPALPYSITFKSLGGNEEVVNTRTFIAQNAQKNTNLSKYYASRPNNILENVLGDATEFESPFNTASDSFFENNKPTVLLGLFVFMLISAIPFYSLYTKNDTKRRK